MKFEEFNNKEQIEKFADKILQKYYTEEISVSSFDRLKCIEAEDFVFNLQKEIAQFEDRELNPVCFSLINAFLSDVKENDYRREKSKKDFVDAIKKQLEEIVLRKAIKKNQENK